jgi:Domain of unknown function (DUF4845)
MFSPDISSQNRPSGRTALLGRSRSRQAGMTAVGILVLALFVGLFAFAALRLTPVYLNYMKVAGVLDGVFKEFDGQSPTRTEIVTSIRRRFDVESVSIITARDIKVLNQGGGFKVEAVYDHDTPFIGNLSFSVHFDKRVTVRR